MTILDVTKIHNFLSVLKYVAKIVIVFEISTGRYAAARAIPSINLLANILISSQFAKSHEQDLAAICIGPCL